MKEKEHIKELLEDALPLVDFDSDFLFSELDSLGVTTILMVLSDALRCLWHQTRSHRRHPA